MAVDAGKSGWDGSEIMAMATEQATRVDRTTAAVKAHKDSVRLDFADIVSYLKDHLGAGPVSVITDGADAKTIARWASGESTPRTIDFERRLRAAYHIFQVIQAVEAPPTIRAWFLGMNPQLDDEAPVEALVGGRERQVFSAARAFVNGG
jgi:hypothetical protein